MSNQDDVPAFPLFIHPLIKHFQRDTLTFIAWFFPCNFSSVSLVAPLAIEFFHSFIPDRLMSVLQMISHYTFMAGVYGVLVGEAKSKDFHWLLFFIYTVYGKHKYTVNL